MIPCSAGCIYQKDGNCDLASASSFGSAKNNNTCVHYTPRPSVLNHAQWHEVPPQCPTPQQVLDPQQTQNVSRSALE